MPILPNGDILPSHVEVKFTPDFDSGDAFNNHSVRFGEVQEIVYPDDDRNQSKKFVEYRVYVQERANGTANGRMYEHCILMNSLGSLADKSFYTLRADPSVSKNQKRLGLGSKVLILCINGEVNNAVIIGGLRDEKDTTEEKAKAKDLGHHLYWTFNGISAFIDKDGQLVVTYNGKTDADGSRNKDVDAKSVGTRLALLADGSWNVNTRDPDDSSKKDQYIFIDHPNRQTIQQAKKLWQTQVTQGKAVFKASDGVHLNDATDYMLLGESHRNAQKQLHKILKQLITVAGAQLSSAATTNATPVTGGVLAAPAFAAAAAALNAMGQAIDAFEQQAQAKNDFLSKSHKND